MHIHFLGICGTFMGGLACLAQSQGHRVSGSDKNVYPPMSTQLQQLGIELSEGYDAKHLQPAPDLVVIGNAMSRGNPAVEYVLENNIPYLSGPEWLYREILAKRWVLAVAGTHGKTTTSSMLAWILQANGYQPGYLIGGVSENFSTSASLGASDFFVIEADEYDTAFFDKRSKFMHYHPRTLILNNLEFDHADIFSDLNDIQKQFHYLIRTVPASAKILVNAQDKNLSEVLQRGVWSQTETFGHAQGDWRCDDVSAAFDEFDVYYQGKKQGRVRWTLLGQHNVTNGLAALAAAHHVGVSVEHGIAALNQFSGVKRRMEIKAQTHGITIYDDFAHHPTAIATTLQGLRAKVGNEKIFAVVELGSYTMQAGVHSRSLLPALAQADEVLLAIGKDNHWFHESISLDDEPHMHAYRDVDEIIADLAQRAKSSDHILIMSNKAFGDIYQKLPAAISAREQQKCHNN